MRLGVVFPAAHRLGGVERIAWDLLAYLGPRHKTTFVGRDLADAGQLAVDQLQIARRRWLPGTLDFRLASARAMTRHPVHRSISLGVVSAPGDVYWVHSVHRAYLSSPGTVRIGAARVPARARSLLPRHRLLLALEQDYFTRHRPLAVVCTSAREAQDLQELYGLPADLLHVIPNGYDPELFSPSVRFARRDQMRQELGLRPDDVALLFVANELHRKGFGVLLDAVASVGDPRLRVEVVGRASPAPFRSHIRHLGLDSRVRWHGPTPDVARYHAACDLFVLPTTYEPFGLVILEALASGLPVITTRLAGAAPIVGAAGLLQDDPADPEELAELLRLALDETRRAAWQAAAPRRAEPYRWERVFSEVERILTAA